MSHLLDPDLEFQALEIDELRVMATRNGGSVLSRGRALMELGRRASGDAALLGEAGLVRAPENRCLLTVGSVSVSQLGVVGLVAGGSDGAFALAVELAGEWPRDGRADFAWLMGSSGIAWSSESRTGAAARGSVIAEAGGA
jgi:hypothetical protein